MPLFESIDIPTLCRELDIQAQDMGCHPLWLWCRLCEELEVDIDLNRRIHAQLCKYGYDHYLEFPYPRYTWSKWEHN